MLATFNFSTPGFLTELVIVSQLDSLFDKESQAKKQEQMWKEEGGESIWMTRRVIPSAGLNGIAGGVYNCVRSFPSIDAVFLEFLACPCLEQFSFGTVRPREF